MRSAQQTQGQQPNQEGKKVLVHPKAMR
jgi:hypothetical protein